MSGIINYARNKLVDFGLYAKRWAENHRRTAAAGGAALAALASNAIFSWIATETTCTEAPQSVWERVTLQDPTMQCESHLSLTRGVLAVGGAAVAAAIALQRGRRNRAPNPQIPPPPPNERAQPLQDAPPLEEERKVASPLDEVLVGVITDHDEDIREGLAKHREIEDQTARALRALKKRGALSADNLKSLSKENSWYFPRIIKAINTLDEKDCLSDDLLKILFKRDRVWIMTPLFSLISTLNKAGLLNLQNINGCINYSQKHLGVSCEDVVDCLRILDDRHLLTQENLSAVFEKSLFVAFKELNKEPEIIDTEILKIVLEHSSLNAVGHLISGLIILKRNNLLNEENRKLLIQYGKVADGLARALMFLSGKEKPLNPEQRELLVRNVEAFTELFEFLGTRIGPETAEILQEPQKYLTVYEINKNNLDEQISRLTTSEGQQRFLDLRANSPFYTQYQKLLKSKAHMQSSEWENRMKELMSIDFYIFCLRIRLRDEQRVSVMIKVFQQAFEPRPLDHLVQSLIRCKDMVSNNLGVWLESLPNDPPLHCLLPSALTASRGDVAHFLKNWILCLKSKGRDFRDGKKEKLLIEFILRILCSFQLYTKKLKIIEGLCKSGESVYERLVLIDILTRLIPDFIPTTDDSILQLQELRRKAFTEAIGCSDINIDAAFARITAWRDPNAILTYLGKIRELPEPERIPVQTAIGRWMKALIEGNLSELRYGRSPHLNAIRELGKGRFDQTILEWAAQRPLQKIALEESKQEPLYLQLNDAIVRNLGEFNHVPKEKIPYLHRFVSSENSIDELEDEMRHIQSDDPVFKMQQLAFRAMTRGATEEDLNALIQAVADLKEKDSDFAQFSIDLEQFAKQRKDSLHSTSRALLIADTDDAEDLMLLGSETGGCQSVYGVPHLNKSALAYSVDGKNRAIVLKDEKTKKIVARAVIRLVWDGKKPVIFCEKHYLSFQNPNLSRAIDIYALALGSKLNLEVYRSGTPELGKPLHVLGLSTPYEYSDGAGGMQDKPYTIRNAVPLTLPV